MPLIRFEEHFNICVGHKYKPWDLFFGMQEISGLTSSGGTRLKANDESVELILLRKST